MRFERAHHQRDSDAGVPLRCEVYEVYLEVRDEIKWVKALNLQSSGH